MNEEDEMLSCSDCGSEVSEHDAHDTSDGILCGDCISVCESCDTIGSTASNEWESVDNELWCRECAYDHAYYCDGCNEYTSNSVTFTEDSGLAYCEDCDGHLSYCDDCGASYENPCGEHSGGRHIHNYSYRPEPVFHTTSDNERLYFGFELEMEFNSNSSRREAAEYASEALEGFAYLKEDGSLDNGFELVTHPMSFDYLMNEADDLWKVTQTLNQDFSARSYNTSTCGFHIHVSRTGFNGGSHMHRFLNLIYTNEFMFSKLAGRKSERWAKFDDVNSERIEWKRDKDGLRTGEYTQVMARSFKNKLDGEHNTDRYSAVNTQNAATLELRIFKGTLSKTALAAHIQLAHAAVEYTRGLSVLDVRNGALNGDMFREYIKSHADIYADLLQRLERKQILTQTLPISKLEPVVRHGVHEYYADQYRQMTQPQPESPTATVSWYDRMTQTIEETNV